MTRFLKGLRVFAVSVVTLCCIGGLWAWGDYLATQPGTGTTFYAGTINGKQVPGFLLCDATTAAQCAAINGSGQLSAILAAGSVASGAYLDGNNITWGLKSDPVAIAPVTNPWSGISLLKGILNALLGTINVNCTGCSASPTVNPTTPAQWSLGVTGSAPPTTATYIGITSGGNLTGWTGHVTIDNVNPNGPTSAANSSPIVLPLYRHPIGQGLVNVLAVSSANLVGFNCSGIQGATAGFCVAYNATAAPTANATVTSANVLDVCFFDTTSRGCSLQHNGAINFSSGAIVIYMTTAANPFLYTTGTATGFISADVYN